MSATENPPAHPGRQNGLAESSPDPDRTILVAGGAGYIGCVLIPRLLDRGYRVRLLDRLYFGEEALASFRDRIELVVADVRDIPDKALDGVDGVINLSGLSNDPTAEFNPEANWEMNAVATETLGRKCVERGIERYVFASSCSLYDGLPAGMHAEDAPIEPRAAYATSKRYGEEKLIEMAGEGLCPVMLRNGTVYGWSPRHALRPGRQHLRQRRAAHGRPQPARRRLDVAAAGRRPGLRRRDDRRLRGPRREGPRRDLQRRPLQLPDPRAGDDRRRLGAADRAARCALEEAPVAEALARLRVLEREALDHARLHPEPLGARVGDRPARRGSTATAPAQLTDPHGYNIRWLELLCEVKPALEAFPAVL